MCHLFRNKGQTNPTFIIPSALPRLPRVSVAFVQSWFLYGGCAQPLYAEQKMNVNLI